MNNKYSTFYALTAKAIWYLNSKNQVLLLSETPILISKRTNDHEDVYTAMWRGLHKPMRLEKSDFLIEQ